MNCRGNLVSFAGRFRLLNARELPSQQDYTCCNRLPNPGNKHRLVDMNVTSVHSSDILYLSLFIGRSLYNASHYQY